MLHPSPLLLCATRRRELKAKKELEAAASDPPPMTAAPSTRGGRGMRGRGMISSRRSIRPSSRDGFGGGGGRGLGRGGPSGRGGGANELKPLGLGVNEDLINRRRLIMAGPEDGSDDESDDDWDEQGAVSGCGSDGRWRAGLVVFVVGLVARPVEVVVFEMRVSG